MAGQGIGHHRLATAARSPEQQHQAASVLHEAIEIPSAGLLKGGKASDGLDDEPLLGLREHHSVLDFGCGSLRAGRLLIPYLLEGRYYGLEPNRWLIEDAMEHELGGALIDLKRPMAQLAGGASQNKKAQPLG